MAAKKTKVLLPGRRREDAPKVETDVQDFLNVEVLAANDVDPRVRGTAAEQFTVIENAAETDVVEMEFENGLKQWISVEQLRADLAEAGPAEARGSAPPPASGELLIPYSIRREGATRGLLSDLGVRVIKLLRTQLGDGLEARAAELSARGVVEALEKKLEGQLNPAGPGVYHFDDSRNLSGRLLTGVRSAPGSPTCFSCTARRRAASAASANWACCMASTNSA